MLDATGYWEPFEKKMRDESLPDEVIASFRYYFSQYLDNQSHYIPESEILPVSKSDIPTTHGFDVYRNDGIGALKHAAVIKLNGGLGTSMGLQAAKSLIKVKNENNFLEIAIAQIQSLNATHGTAIPFITMDSYRTRNDTEHIVRESIKNASGLPSSFLQHRFPRINKDTLSPVRWPPNPDLEWNPPGHGDIFLALKTSGVLATLLQQDIRYAFISNIDNLGATLDPDMLGYFADSGSSFMMEVAQRTEMDTKGGHLAKTKNGTLLLREAAQCADTDRAFFSDISRHGYFNTNNIWLDLKQLQHNLQRYNNVIPLPLIKNRKNIDASDPATPNVIQLESAMGAAISLFENASALCVPRTRFIPVKKCSDLFLLWSDVYALSKDFRIIRSDTSKTDDPIINLDSRYYSLLHDLKKRVAHGAPSMKECQSLTIKGDVRFGKNISIAGTVTISNPHSGTATIPDNQRITEDMSF